MPEDNNGENGSNPNNDTLPEGAVSAADAQTLRDTHGAELRSLNEKIAKVTEDGASVLAARDAAEARVEEFGDIESKVTEANEALEAANKTLESKDAEIVKLTESALAQRRQHIKTQYKLEDEQVKDLDGPQLDALEKVLPGVSASTLHAGNLGITGNSNQGELPSTKARETIKAGLAS